MMKATMSSGLLLILLLTVFLQRPKKFAPPLFMTIRLPIWPLRVKTPASSGSRAADLKRATRFEVKPQGVCRDELCFPLPKARHDSVYS